MVRAFASSRNGSFTVSTPFLYSAPILRRVDRRRQRERPHEAAVGALDAVEVLLLDLVDRACARRESSACCSRPSRRCLRAACPAAPPSARARRRPRRCRPPASTCRDSAVVFLAAAAVRVVEHPVHPVLQHCEITKRIESCHRHCCPSSAGRQSTADRRPATFVVYRVPANSSSTTSPSLTSGAPSRP